jgi:hypothetical protein
MFSKYSMEANKWSESESEGGRVAKLSEVNHPGSIIRESKMQSTDRNGVAFLVPLASLLSTS